MSGYMMANILGPEGAVRACLDAIPGSNSVTRCSDVVPSGGAGMSREDVVALAARLAIWQADTVAGNRRSVCVQEFHKYATIRERARAALDAARHAWSWGPR